MAILSNRIKIKNYPLELSKLVFRLIGKFFTIILLIISLYLLYFSAPKPVSNMVLEVTGKTLSVFSFFYNGSINSFKASIDRIVNFKDLETQNLQLNLKLSGLKKIIQVNTELKAENKELKKLLKVSPEIKKNFITAKVIGISITPFSSSAILTSGSKNNVKLNDVVRGSSGLVGIISAVSEYYSKVRLISDHNSRIPVITGMSKTTGIIAQQDNILRIIYLEDNNISIGEVVYTSGEGKVFPKGIPVALITKLVDNTAFFELIEKFNKLEYVIIELNT